MRGVYSHNLIVNIRDDKRLIIIVDGITVLIMRVARIGQGFICPIQAHVVAAKVMGVRLVDCLLNNILVVFVGLTETGVGFFPGGVVANLLFEEDGLCGNKLVWPELVGEVNTGFDELFNELFGAGLVGEDAV